jgi:hypothetical protein
MRGRMCGVWYRVWCLPVAVLVLVARSAPLASQSAMRDSVRADSMHRTSRTGMIPAGFGSLRQDDISLKLQNQGLAISAIPLDENVIRTLAPDSYRTLRALRESKSKQLEAIRLRLGLPSVATWYVTFYTLEQGDARYDAFDFLVRSQGQDFRPLDILGLTTRFGEGRVSQREKQSAIYVFDPSIDLSQPVVLTASTQQSTAWADILQKIDRERSLVWSRSTPTPPPSAPVKP